MSQSLLATIDQHTDGGLPRSFIELLDNPQLRLDDLMQVVDELEGSRSRISTVSKVDKELILNLYRGPGSRN